MKEIDNCLSEIIDSKCPIKTVVNMIYDYGEDYLYALISRALTNHDLKTARIIHSGIQLSYLYQINMSQVISIDEGYSLGLKVS